MRQTFLRSSIISIVLLAFVLGPFAASLAAQTRVAKTPELPRHTEVLHWSSGSHDGHYGQESEPARLAVKDVLSIPAAPWIQLVFGDRKLPSNSRIEITSLLDGATQTLNAATLEQWGGRSAYFNGDSVEIRLYAGVNARGAEIMVKEVVVGDWSFGNKSICGTDNRIASNEPKVGRVDPIGCTAWLTDNGKILTAGHCLAGSGNTTLSFNPPQSLSNGTVQFPGPQDQYSINQSSFNFTNGGVGNDWGLFTVFNNSQHGQQPHARQGAFSLRQDYGPSSIRITGFGVDTGSTNQTNQTHAGGNAGSSSNTMRYTADTMGGNSGSPVLDEATGESVGIHTHGGCTSSGGSNKGTSFFRSTLWSAINSGSGVCSFLDQVPTLSGSTSAVTASGQYSSSYAPWKAFDSSTTGSIWISEVWETPAWIAYDFGTSKWITRYRITHTNGSLTSRAPKDWQFQGWNGSSWVTIDTRSNETGWSSGETRTYNVADPGSYTRYRLNISDDNDSRSGVVVISISNLEFMECQSVSPPNACFSASTTSGNAPLYVSFNASCSSDSDGSIVSYSWDMGDGTTRSGQWVSHNYYTPGFYVITLTVTDNNGLTDTDIEFVNVCGSGGPIPFDSDGIIPDCPFF